MNERQKNVAQYCDGVRTSAQIAELANDSQKYVQQLMLKYDLPRRKIGSATGSLNGSYKTGRKIDRDGYVLVAAPENHPYSRKRKNRRCGVILEHRLVMEQKIGRYLTPSEVVDHIDGLHLHNYPSNLRLFPSNADHLKATLKDKIPAWTKEGVSRMNSTRDQQKESQTVHTYGKMKKNGDVRLMQILRAALQFGIDSPYLSGSSHHLEKAGIVDFSHSSLERALDDLYQKYA